MPTTRIFKMRRPSAVPTSRLPALRESATALLRALSSGNPTPHDIARAISLDPVLVFELLLTAPLGGNDAEKLLDAISNRIAGIDGIGLPEGDSVDGVRVSGVGQSGRCHLDRTEGISTTKIKRDLGVNA